MIYRVKGRQVSYGEAVGIILLENYAPFIPGDVANATTYDFPVRFQRVENFSVERIFKHDMSLLDPVLEAGRALVREGVRAVTGDCGFMVIYQGQLAAALEVPVFMSSLLQIPFLRHMIGLDEKIGIITANSESLDEFVLQRAGADSSAGLLIKGLQGKGGRSFGFGEDRNRGGFRGRGDRRPRLEGQDNTPGVQHACSLCRGGAGNGEPSRF
jgi:hypothetical protein